MTPHSPAADSFAAIAVVSPGLEEAAAAELTALGAEAVQPLRRAAAAAQLPRCSKPHRLA